MRPPDRNGPGGQAWLIARDAKGITPAMAASLACWVVHAPKRHPFWEWWIVGVCHLRPVDGVEAFRYYPGAEFELLIGALDPELGTPDPDDVQSFAVMSPPDVERQFDGVSEHDAIRLCGMAVDQIVEGRMSPDSDYRRIWNARISSTLLHMREGRHAPN